jgi:hypothetical protein
VGDNSIFINCGSTVSAASSYTTISYVRRSDPTSDPIPNLIFTDSNNTEFVYCSSTVTSKPFIIDHPIDEDKYLVHACLEGPEGGVYYRGIGEITNNQSTSIILPDYVRKLSTEFTVQVTQIYSHDNTSSIPVKASKVKNNSFNVYGENCEFYWTVFGKRGDVEVEPLKATTHVKGNGPYKWI